MAFDYNSIDIDDINQVEIVSKNTNSYQRFLENIYNSDDSDGSEAIYERWAREYPSIAREYKTLAEQALEDPHQLADELDEEIFRILTLAHLRYTALVRGGGPTSGRTASLTGVSSQVSI